MPAIVIVCVFAILWHAHPLPAARASVAPATAAEGAVGFTQDGPGALWYKIAASWPVAAYHWLSCPNTEELSAALSQAVLQSRLADSRVLESFSILSVLAVANTSSPTRLRQLALPLAMALRPEQQVALAGQERLFEAWRKSSDRLMFAVCIARIRGRLPGFLEAYHEMLQSQDRAVRAIAMQGLRWFDGELSEQIWEQATEIACDPVGSGEGLRLESCLLVAKRGSLERKKRVIEKAISTEFLPFLAYLALLAEMRAKDAWSRDLGACVVAVSQGSVLESSDIGRAVVAIAHSCGVALGDPAWIDMHARRAADSNGVSLERRVRASLDAGNIEWDVAWLALARRVGSLLVTPAEVRACHLGSGGATVSWMSDGELRDSLWSHGR